MKTLIKRPVSGKADYQRLADFLNLCEAATYREDFTTAEMLEHEATSPGFDPAQDQCLWQDADGQLVGLTELWIPQEPEENRIDGYMAMEVHPQRRGSLELEMLSWAETRLRQVGQLRGYPVKLWVHCRDTESDRLSLFKSQGFIYERQFLTEARSLLEPIPEIDLPDGFQLIDNRQSVPPQDWVDLYNQTFIDHWNFHPVTVEQHQHWLSEPDYRPELDLMVVAADGALAGFCYCHIDFNSNAHFGRREGWVGVLGTRRGYRRMGLGRSLLLAGLHCLKTAGMETALLGVDAENPNFAYTLYHSVGFSPKFARLSFGKTL